MIGTRKLNASRNMFVVGDKWVWRPSGKGNQNKIQINDWVQGPIGPTELVDWAKYKGGDTEDPANYDIPSSVDPEDYPDL